MHCSVHLSLVPSILPPIYLFVSPPIYSSSRGLSISNQPVFPPLPTNPLVHHLPISLFHHLNLLTNLSPISPPPCKPLTCQAY